MYNQLFLTASMFSLFKNYFLQSLIHLNQSHAQHHLTEAQLCIEDCYHETENLPQELEAAEHALEQACAAMVDFLDVLRSQEDMSSNGTDNNNSNNNNQWLDLRRNQVAQFKGLRQQLYALQKHPQDETE